MTKPCEEKISTLIIIPTCADIDIPYTYLTPFHWIAVNSFPTHHPDPSYPMVKVQWLFLTLGFFFKVRPSKGEQVCDCTWCSTHLLFLRVLGELIPYQHTHHLPFHPYLWWWRTDCSILALGLPMLGRGPVRGLDGWLYLHILNRHSFALHSDSAPCTAVVHAVLYCCCM